MKLLILGATGGVGREIVTQAIERGHKLTAFVRAPESLETFASRIDIVRGDPLNCPALARVMEGHDAVISGFGARVPYSKADANLLQRFALALTKAMLHAGMPRAVIVSMAFLFKDAIFPPAYLLGKLLFPDTVADGAQMEDVIVKSGLDWTLVRPPRLTDGPRTGKYRVREGHLPAFGFAISRADVAHFMIQTAERNSLVGQIVGVCN